MFDHFVGLALKGLEIQRSYLRCITANKYLHVCELLEVIKSSSVTFNWSNVSLVCLFVCLFVCFLFKLKRNIFFHWILHLISGLISGILAEADMLKNRNPFGQVMCYSIIILRLYRSETKCVSLSTLWLNAIVECRGGHSEST